MDTFSALADPTRRSIVELLAHHGRLSTADITTNFQMSQPAISQHLKVLRDAHLVDAEKKAQQRLYTLNFEGLTEIEQWIQTTTKQWNRRLDALERVIQAEKRKRKQ